MEKQQQAEQSKQRSQQKQRDILREKQQCLDRAWNMGHPWDTAFGALLVSGQGF